MRICQTLNNLARLQNNPVGNFPYRKKDRFHNEPKTPQHTKTTPLLYGLNTPTRKIHTQPSQSTQPYKTPTIKRKHNKQQKTLGRNPYNSFGQNKSRNL